MPELPEVETIRLGLQKRIIGLTIKNINVTSPKSFIGFSQQIIGKKVLRVWRRAKILGIDVTGDLSLLFHLKMTGQLVYVKNQNLKLPSARVHSESSLRGAQGEGKTQNGNSKVKTEEHFIGGHPTPDMRDGMPNSHTRVIFEFSGDSHLYFNDQRKFGWVKMVKSQSLIVHSLLKGLGPEPLEKNFTWQVLKNNLLKHKNMPVKVVMMDQKVISGVGNIYANEACFNAGIDPRTKVVKLTDVEFKGLYFGVLKALRDGIKYGGATRAHFVDSEGHKGYFLDYAYVYGLDKHKCKRCGQIIKKVQLRGRGTYFCPKCQK